MSILGLPPLWPCSELVNVRRLRQWHWWHHSGDWPILLNSFKDYFLRTLRQSVNGMFFTQSYSTEQELDALDDTSERHFLLSLVTFVIHLCWSQINYYDHMKLNQVTKSCLPDKETALVPMSGHLELHLWIATTFVRKSWIFHFLTNRVMLSEEEGRIEEWEIFRTYDEHQDGRQGATGLLPGCQA